jgi:hypothetical protein
MDENFKDSVKEDKNNETIESLIPKFYFGEMVFRGSSSREIPGYGAAKEALGVFESIKNEEFTSEEHIEKLRGRLSQHFGLP